jgi:hypothetical protein
MTPLRLGSMWSGTVPSPIVLVCVHAVLAAAPWQVQNMATRTPEAIHIPYRDAEDLVLYCSLTMGCLPSFLLLAGV